MQDLLSFALLQCIVSIFLTFFFLNHGWHYDRFDSLNFFKAGRAVKSREAFKRIMVILYITGSPCFAIQGGMYAWIKYQVGFLPLSHSGMPLPYEFWPEHLQRYILPLQYLNALAWACELIVHLEELLFFLHLIELQPSSPPWFKSVYFKIVLIGSFFSLLGTFGPVALYSSDPLKGEAVLYLIGSSFILLSNFMFFKVFYAFPAFLANLKLAGGSSEVVIRLKSFHELNKIRVAARFSFGVPLFILSVDGLTSKKLNSSLVWTDVFLLTGLVGFSIQATATLLIFFPRNIAREAGVLRSTVSGGISSTDHAPVYKPAFPPSPSQPSFQSHPSPAVSHRPFTGPSLTPLPPSRRPSRQDSDGAILITTTEDVELEKLDSEKAFSFGTTFPTVPSAGRVFVLPPRGSRHGSVDDGTAWQRRPSLPGPGGGPSRGSAIPAAIRNFHSPIDIV